MRQRLYENNAEKQRAYRAHRHATHVPAMVEEKRENSVTRERRPTRPARIQRLLREAEDLADEYGCWREAIPANLSSGPLAEQLDDTITRLEDVVGLLTDIDPPRIGH